MNKVRTISVRRYTELIFACRRQCGIFFLLEFQIHRGAVEDVSGYGAFTFASQGLTVEQRRISAIWGKWRQHLQAGEEESQKKRKMSEEAGNNEEMGNNRRQPAMAWQKMLFVERQLQRRVKVDEFDEAGAKEESPTVCKDVYAVVEEGYGVDEERDVMMK